MYHALLRPSLNSFINTHSFIYSPNTNLRLLALFRSPGGAFGVRHLQTFFLFLCLTIAYAMRVNLSVAIIAMVDRNATNPNFEEYQWNENTQSVILSSFFWGYIFTQIPAGKLAQRYGGKMMLTFTMSICSALNILMPFGAKWGDWKVVVALRVMQGLCQGFIFPSTHTLLSKWAPVEERGKLGTYCYSGGEALNARIMNRLMMLTRVS